MARNEDSLPTHEIKTHFGFWNKAGMFYSGCKRSSGWVASYSKDVKEVTCKNCQKDFFYKKLAAKAEAAR